MKLPEKTNEYGGSSRQFKELTRTAKVGAIALGLVIVVVIVLCIVL